MAQLRHTGQYHEIDGESLTDRMAAFEAEAQAPGDSHIWVFNTMYRLTEENAEKASRGEDLGFLDRENLVMAGGPICWRCEAVDFNKYPCPGYRRVVMSQLVEGSGG